MAETRSEGPRSDAGGEHLDDRRTHLGVGPNAALCVKASGDPNADNSPKVWGHWLTKDREDVDCLACLEWMHA